MKTSTERINSIQTNYLPPRAATKPRFYGPRKILATTDLSARGEKAVMRAAKLTTEHEAFLEILCVRESSRGETGWQRRADEVLRETMIKCALPSERVAIRQAVGRPVAEIIRHATESAADLIVAGDHEINAISAVFIRTTAEAVLRAADRPLLIVKRTPRTVYRRVLVPVDFSEHSRNALQFAIRLAPRAELHVLHAYEGVERQLWRTDVNPSEIMRYRREFAKKARAEMRGFLDTIERGAGKLTSGIWFGRAPYVIDLVAERLRADLVAVGSASRKGLSRILLGSVAEHVMRHVDCDVLVVRSEPSATESDANRPDAA